MIDEAVSCNGVQLALDDAFEYLAVTVGRVMRADPLMDADIESDLVAGLANETSRKSGVSSSR